MSYFGYACTLNLRRNLEKFQSLGFCFYIWDVNYLGIDYGEHRVGIAFADSEMKWAFARETIDQKKTDLMTRLSELVKLNKIDIFVVGMPYRPDGRKDG